MTKKTSSQLPQQIPKPKNTSPVPDEATKKGVNDYTGSSGARDRVLRINLGVLKYGTDDKTHAAAIVLSMMIFMVIIGVLIFGEGNDWTKEVFRWLGGAFLFVAGIAIGKGSENGSDES